MSRNRHIAPTEGWCWRSSPLPPVPPNADSVFRLNTIFIVGSSNLHPVPSSLRLRSNGPNPTKAQSTSGAKVRATKFSLHRGTAINLGGAFHEFQKSIHTFSFSCESWISRVRGDGAN